jgi:hypothetical protein
MEEKIKIEIEFTMTEAKKLVSAVGVKKMTGNLLPDLNPTDKVLLEVARKLHKRLTETPNGL